MFETGLRQVRLVAGIVSGRRLDPGNVERLVRDAVRTLEELGAPGDDVEQLLDGPFAEPRGRAALQSAALQRTVRRLVSVSPYYRRLLAGCDVSDLTVAGIADLPVTSKRELLAEPDAFLAVGSRPFLSTRSTGTTGRPVEIWLSRYEYELWPALSALSGLLRGEVLPTDSMQVNISSRATAAVQNGVAVARLVGLRIRILGLVNVEESLDSLLSGGEDAPTILASYPSYLAQLATLALHRGLTCEHFRLRTVYANGEVLSSTVRALVERTFGAPVVDSFGMTEVMPVSARSCEQDHLHHDLNTGVVEVLGLHTGKPAGPGELGTVVITPFYPYRECMPVLRYDTRDIVRRPDQALTCSLRGVPATSAILGKAEHLLHLPDRTVTTRDLVEACDSLPGVLAPVRYRAAVVDDAVHVELPDMVVAVNGPAATQRHLAAAGLNLMSGAFDAKTAGAVARLVRADLVETSFTR